MVNFFRRICYIAFLMAFSSGGHAQTVLSPSTASTDALTSASQLISYQLILAESGNVAITFQHAPLSTISTSWRVSVKTTTGSELLSFLSGQTDGSLTVPVGLPAGSYVVVVTTSYANNNSLVNVPYQLSYSLTPNTATNAFEQQTGVVTATATPMNADVGYSGTLASHANGSQEIDGWSFTLSQAGNVALNFRHAPLSTISTSWRVSVKTTTGSELLSFLSGQTDGSLTIPVGLPAGSYVVEVTSSYSGNYSLSNVSYQLSYSLTPNTTTNAFEQQTGVATATPMSADVGYSGTLASHANNSQEIDSWSFTLSQAGNVALNFRHAPLSTISTSWRVSVKTSTGSELLSFLSGQTDGSLTIPVGLPAGSYVVEVTSSYSGNYSLSNVPYQLSYSLTPNTTTNAFEQQTGVVTATATPMNADVGYSGTLASHANNSQEIDSWSFTLSQAGNVALNFRHAPLSTISGSWRVSVKTTTGSELLSFLSGQTDGSLTVPVGLPAGSYVVEVTTSYSGNGTLWNVPYQLSYSLTPAVTFENELNNSSTSGSAVPFGTEYVGSIQPKSTNSDVDYFKFTLDFSRNLELKLLPASIPSSSLALVLTNLDTGALMYSGNTGTTAGIRTVVKAPAGQYSISVAGNGGNTGLPYKLTVNDLGQAVRYAYTLRNGWNLLGNSFDGAISVADFCAGNTALVVSMWKWDGVNIKWQFYSPLMTTADLAAYAQSKGYTVLQQINPREGFWVNANGPSSTPEFTLVPTVLVSDDLGFGWNLVASDGNLDPRQLNSRLGIEPPTYSADGQPATARPANFLTLWAWNNSSSKWYFYAPSIDQPGSSTLPTYTASKNYLNFFDSTSLKTIDRGDGFWINK